MLTLIILILIADYILERYLDWINIHHWSNTIPEEMKGVYDEDKYRKSQDYEKTKTRFGFISSTFNLILILVILFTGSFALLNNWALSVTAHPVWSALLFFGAITVLSDILNLPFSYYRTFIIEENFGFNRMNLATFFLDKLKGYLLGGLIGGSLLYLFIWLYSAAGTNWWVYAWMAFSVVMLFMTMFYASVIVPLFNKLTPLPDGELRKAIESYCGKVGFKLNNLFVMDGSKRSSKANAFFSGIGPKKKIVLFDTLINNHTNNELVAVLAHEIGHYKKKHTRLSFILTILQTGIMLFIFSKVIDNPGLSLALGSPKPYLQLGMLAFGLLYSPLSLLISLIMNMISRKNEFEADHFAKTTFDGESLINALKKLSVNNLSNLLPHPVYVFFHYSHPPLLERLKALKKG
ncbi:MAG TPA: M48 family metallopeptidase [Bacteroidia bacterium]|nr:M48 family metallopeptidase [Bacteroidia bacterium]